VWNFETGECIHSIKIHTDYITSLIKLDIKTIISGSGDKSISVLNISYDKYFKKRSLDIHNAHITCLLKLDQNRIASASADKTIKIWNVNFECENVLAEHRGVVRFLLKIHDNLLASSSDVAILIWNITNFKYIYCLNINLEYVSSLILIEKNKLITGGVGNEIKIWEISN